jgi:hypothetical protein
VSASPIERSTGSGPGPAPDRAADARRRAELRDFLMARRARVTPADAGLPDGGRRRTPGLRREEVAVLAGVGASWYQWLEQGRDITVSPQVLDAVGRVLRLGEAERRHLYVLAGLNPPLPRPDPVAPVGPENAGLQRLIDAWMPFPAHILDPYWNAVAFNDAARAVLYLNAEVRNCLTCFFTEPAYRTHYADWERVAGRITAQYRAATAERPGDEGYAEVVNQLLAECPDFARLWERGEVEAPGLVTKTIEHHVAGTLVLESTQLRVPARPDLVIVLHNPVPGTGTAEKLEWLATPEGRRSVMRSADTLSA